MSQMTDFNQRVIAEFRANEGRVGGSFEGAPIVLVHNTGRRSGTEHVTPMMYRPDAQAPDTVVHVFASNAGKPSHPAWYHNLTAAETTMIERGTETYRVSVRELPDAERQMAWEAMTSENPEFAKYDDRTRGIREIPVIELKRV